MSDLDEALFLDGGLLSGERYVTEMASATAAVIGWAQRNRERAAPRTRGGDLAFELAQVPVISDTGEDLKSVLAELSGPVLDNSVNLGSHGYLAHLVAPPLIPALAAASIAAAINQSMDSYDQAPAATFVEERVVSKFVSLAGFGSQGDGVFTSGATQSNLMGLCLARQRAAGKRDITKFGLDANSSRWTILCSAAAHFSVMQAAAILGLGASAVASVATDADGALDIAALDKAFQENIAAGRQVIALVLTAGTTATGAVDPLREAALRAQAHGAWVHVDAAAGGALLVSRRYRQFLDGLDLADSIALDFHKLFFQPIACGLFLVASRSELGALNVDNDYLDPPEDADLGVVNLVRKSLQTTRPFDALKILVSLRVLGLRRFAALVDHTLDLARTCADALRTHPKMELVTGAVTNTVTFRYLPEMEHLEELSEPLAQALVDRVNLELRDVLWQEGPVALGRCRIAGRPVLKVTFMNPTMRATEVCELIDHIADIGDGTWQQLAGTPEPNASLR